MRADVKLGLLLVLLAGCRFSFAAANLAPFVLGTTAYQVDEDDDLNITGVTVQDSDAGNGSLKITLSCTHGVLSLERAVGLTFLEGAAVNSRSMIFTAKLADINAAIHGITYRPDLNYFGPDTLHFVADDQGNTGTGGAKKDTKDCAITVNSVNDLPTLVLPTVWQVQRNSTTTPIPFTIGDVDNFISELFVTAVSSDQSKVSNSAIVMEGLGASRTLTITPNPNASGHVNITVRVTDIENDFTAAILNLAINDMPVINAIFPDTTIAEDTATPARQFSITDTETAPDNLTLEGISDNPALVAPSGIQFTGSGNFRSVRVTPILNASGECIITVRVSDEDGGFSEKSFKLTVTSSNDAPVITAAGLLQLDPVLEDDVNNAGTLIGDFIRDENGTLAIADSDPQSLYGIGIVAIHASSGTWEYSINNGGNWSPVPISVSTTAALLLADDGQTRIRFVPKLDFNGKDSLAFCAWDQTLGANGQISDVSAAGGTSAFSGSALAELEVLKVNDRPILLLGPDEAVRYGDPERVVEAFVSMIPGPADESDQVAIRYDMTNDRPDLFSVQPSISADGSLRFTPIASNGVTQSATLTVIVQDSGGIENGANDTSLVGTVKITMYPIGTPVARNIYKAILEEELYDGAFDIAVDEGKPVTLFYTLPARGNVLENVGSRPERLIVDANNLTFSYRGDLNEFGDDSFTYWFSDGNATSNVATVRIHIIWVNDAPTLEQTDAYFLFSPPVALVNGGEQKFTNFMIIDAGAEDENETQILVVSELVFEDPSQAIYFLTPPTLSLDGTLTLTPNPDAFPGGYIDIDLTISAFDDGGTANGGLDAWSETFTVAVAEVFLRAVPVDRTMDEDETIGIRLAGELLPGAPEDEEISQYIIDSLPANGVVKAKDDLGNPYTLTPTLLPFVTDNPTISYVPNANWHGEDSFSYFVTGFPAGQTPRSLTAPIHITVNPVDDPVYVSEMTWTLAEDGVASGILPLQEVDGDPFAVHILVPPIHGALQVAVSTGAYVYTPDLNYFGTDNFTFFVSDPRLDSELATIVIDILPVNDAPVAMDAIYQLELDGTFEGTLQSFDVESDPVTFTITQFPQFGVLEVLEDPRGAFIYTAGEGFIGYDEFRYVANDGQADSNVARIRLAINTPPSAVPKSIVLDEDTTYSGTLNGVDDGFVDPLSFEIVTQPRHGVVTLNPSTGAIVYKPELNYNGSDSFTFVVNDGLDASDPAAASIQIYPIYDAPIAQNSTVQTQEGAVVAGQLNASSPDGNALVYSIVALAEKGNFALDAQTGAFTYSGFPGEYGDDVVPFKVVDQYGVSAAATVTLQIEFVNDPPVAINMSLTVVEDTATSGTLNAKDDSQSFFFFATTPGHGSIQVERTTGAFTYTPHTNYNGNDSFDFYVVDQDGLMSNTAAVSVTITPLQDAPIISQPQVFPNPAGVGQFVFFNSGVTEPDGETFTTTWRFGDGATATGNNVTHAYDTPNIFHIELSVTDGKSTTVRNLSVVVLGTVAGTDKDSDGDGFSDAIEIAAGTGEFDDTSTPFGGAHVTRGQLVTMGVDGVQVSLSFAKPVSDTIALKASLPIPTDAVFAGQKFVVDVGGVAHQFTIDGKLRSFPKGNDTLSVKLDFSNKLLRLTMKRSRGSFSEQLRKRGLVDADTSTFVTLPITVIFNDTAYQKIMTPAYSARARKIGKAATAR